MFDFHIHSNFSDDSTTTIAEHAVAACNLGLTGICITDHVDIDYANPQIKFELNYPEYCLQTEKEKQRYKGRLEIFKGIEIGLQPHIINENKAYLESKSFDFVIGSIHCVNKKELYGSSFFEGLGEQEAIEGFFYDLMLCLEDSHIFDVLGHLDVIRRYLPKGEAGFLYSRYKENVDAALLKLIQAGKGIEINTSGKRYGLSSFHPMPEIIKRYGELGGEVITLGSDANTPSHLGFGFRNVIELLQGLGFKYYTIFKERKPFFIKI